MLDLAGVTAADVVYDLGSGDGRIVIEAARKYGARAVGIELDPELNKKAARNAEKAGVGGKVTFVRADFFKTDLSDASVVTLFLSPEHQRAVAAEASTRAQAWHAHRLSPVPNAARLEARSRPHRQGDARVSLDDPLEARICGIRLLAGLFDRSAVRSYGGRCVAR